MRAIPRWNDDGDCTVSSLPPQKKRKKRKEKRVEHCDVTHNAFIPNHLCVLIYQNQVTLPVVIQSRNDSHTERKRREKDVEKRTIGFASYLDVSKGADTQTTQNSVK